MGIMSDARAYAQTGAEIRNVATVSFDQGANRLVVPTNEVVLVLEAARTSSTIEFFRFAPTANTITTNINGSNFSPSGELSGPFQTVGPPVTSNGALLDLSGNVPLAPADRYLAGELIFVRVVDPGQNSSPTIIESISITVIASTGDEIVLQLFESGPDTGEFFAYIPSTADATGLNDNTLSTPDDTSLTATYIDSFDATDVSIDTAVIEPFSRVFDSITGDLIDGAIVTLIDISTGQPADVLGVDGVSSYPSTVETGTVVTDSSGLQYPLGVGEFLFPVLRGGSYRIEVETPEGFVFASVLDASAFTSLDNAPFRIIDGSFGGVFSVDTLGPLNFDVPLDGAGELVVTKQASVDVSAIGDFVAYTVDIENRNQAGAFLRVQDILPEGFRYQTGSARKDGVLISDPEIAPDGETLLFDGGVLRPGESTSLTYVTLVSAGTPLGEAVNEVVALDGSGEQVSNRAEAAIIVREDLLRSTLTIIGRVAEDACLPDQEWARDITDGVGVENVRLYLETGDYVVTDQDGLFHFENVQPGTHVVQIDEQTLPQGYEPVVCEENSRYAGSAISKFVDATGGTIWRANFYLERTGEVAVEEAAYEFNDALEHLDYDQAWLDQQDDTVAWAYPDTTKTPSNLSVNIGIKHAAYDTVKLKLNGAPAPALNYAGADTSTDRTVGVSRWRGLDIKNGRNDFEAEVVDQFGKVKQTLKQSIWFVSRIERATLVDDQSTLVADGRSNPVVAVRLTDSAGRPVHAGRVVEVDLAAPYRLKSTEQFEGEAPVTAGLANISTIQVGPDGITRIELAPTLETGRARLLVTLDSGRQENIEVFLRPEKRDWILVGLAEGSLGLERLDGPGAIDSNDLLNEGRVAFFAKGVIKGDWLLTLAVDTARRRGDADGDLFAGQIDPNAVYTLFGDRTFQDREAESRFPFYVKLEKNTFQVLFGDYDTDLNDTTLGRYNRRLSGLSTLYEGKNVSFSGFAAQTNQGFTRDEFAADGTSGPFNLSAAPLVRNSDTIFVETRDRFRPDEVVSVLRLSRFVDYDIDFDTGEIIFRTPISATDEAFNPKIIVAEYETSAAVERNLVIGGRVSARAFNDRVEVGATYIREEGSDTVADAVSQLGGVDLTVHLDKSTELHAEYAVTNRDDAAVAATGAGAERADALLVEIVRRQESYTAAAYYREDEAGFGLGQQSSATTGGVRRFGGSISAEIGRKRREETGGNAAHFVDAEAYREDSLQSGDSRNVIEAAVRREGPLLNASIGVRAVEENVSTVDDSARRSTLLTTSVNKNFANLGLNVSAAHEQPIAGDESTLFPQRTILGVDKTITKKATLNVRHEILNGENADGNNTIVGVTAQPFNGTTVAASADLITQDSARRIGATVGVDQLIRINDKWSAGIGVARRANISGDQGDPQAILPDAALSPLETAPASPLTQSESFSSVYAGLGYRGDRTAASSRLELRDSALGTRLTGTLGAAREANDQLSYAFASRIENNNIDGAADTVDFDARVGVAYRPRALGPVLFNRFDASYQEVQGDTTSWKLVNNLALNAAIGKRTQVSVFHGIRYSRSTFFGESFNELTNLIGGEARYDVTERLDLGFSGSALISGNGQTEYQIGPSVGYSPADNTWISLGWNVLGFNDNDFEAAEFSRDGPFIKLRVKFDQHTARDLLKRISPTGR